MNSYAVELLFENPPTVTRGAFLEAVRGFSPQASLLDGNAGLTAPIAGSVAVVHPDYSVMHPERPVVAQTMFVPRISAPDSKRLDAALQQSWGFPAAAEALARATCFGLLTDLLAERMGRLDRLAAFQKTLDGLLTVTRPLAIHWIASQQLVDPAEYARGVPRQYPAPFAGALNVRMFRVDGQGPGAMVMDTRGLDVFDLPDIQCRFRDLEPGQVGPVLYNTASYIFEQGDIIQDGETIPGHTPDTKWRCRHAEAQIGPSRPVLNLTRALP